MVGTEGLNENIPSPVHRVSYSHQDNPFTVETVQQCQKQQQQQQLKSEAAAYSENMDEEDEEDKYNLQNEPGSPDGSKQSDQCQAIFDTPQNRQEEQGVTEVRQEQGHEVNTSRAPSKEQHPKYKQKDTRYKKEVDAEQEVTDPITHSLVAKHDFTSQELKHTLENIPLTGSRQLPTSDIGERPKSRTQSDKLTKGKEPHAGSERSFSPNHGYAKGELIRALQFAFNIGVGVILLIMALALLLGQLFDIGIKLRSSDEIDRKPWARAILTTITLEAAVFGFGVWSFRRWVEKNVDHFWENQDWESEGQNKREKADAHTTESTQWLNSLLASVWPLVNPDLFASLADNLEDSMQANLPKLVNMINVEDLGQGSEALRILGVRWLPSDATDCSVSAGKKVHAESNARDAENNAHEDNKYEDLNSQQQNQKDGQNTMNEPQKELHENGMKTVETEEGDSVSLEVTFAYKARPAGKKLSRKAKNAHIFLGIYLPAGIRLRKYSFSSLNFYNILPTHECEAYFATSFFYTAVVQYIWALGSQNFFSFYSIRRVSSCYCFQPYCYQSLLHRYSAMSFFPRRFLSACASNRCLDCAFQYNFPTFLTPRDFGVLIFSEVNADLCSSRLG